MEEGQRRGYAFIFSNYIINVLILVVMEEGQRPIVVDYADLYGVLILVVMEEGQRPDCVKANKLFILS